ncbi:MAG: S8 family serine peptidase [Pirellulaceae bacterium]
MRSFFHGMFPRFQHGARGLRRAAQLGTRLRRLELLEPRNLLAADLAPTQLIVQFKEGVSEAAESAFLGGLISSQLVEHIHAAAGRLDVLQLPAGASADDLLQQLRDNPAVAYAEPDYLVQPSSYVSNDTYYTSGSLWGMYGDDATSPTNAFGSQADEAWAAGNVGSTSVVVGIIDEGIDYNHPDLAANIWTNPVDVADGVDNDGNGYIDDIHGWDFANNNNTIFDGTTTNGVDHHGTHVAGTIGGVGGNGQGVAGVNWNVKMISAKFLGPNGGYISDAIEALDYLTTLKTTYGVNIVASNNSWGGGGYSQAMQDAITRAANAGILFVAAAGNGGADGVGDNNDTTASYPSNYSTLASAGYESVIAVAAINSSGSLASFSNFGASTVDLGAPGVGIVSTLPFNTYGNYSGTSMATPHVTGATALYAAANPGASAADIRAAIVASAQSTPTASLAGKTVTGGRLNISAQPALRISDVSKSEGNSGTNSFTFTVTLPLSSASPLLPVTVNYATADNTATTVGSDYTAAAGTLLFDPGVTSRTITVNVSGDTIVESNETFFVNLADAVGAPIADAQGVGTIVNDDFATPSISINSVANYEGNRGFTKMVFTVSLSAASNQTVSVAFSTASGTAISGSDFKAASGVLSFSPGVTSRTITVSVYGDKTSEPDELFYLDLTSPTNASLATSRGTGTIRNDDGGASGGSAGARSLSPKNVDGLMAAVGSGLFDPPSGSSRKSR